MIIHLFNSSSVSGPERLVLPALAQLPALFTILNLKEKRLTHLSEKDPLQDYSESLGLRYEHVPVASRWDSRAIAILQAKLKGLSPRLVHAHAIKASIYLAQAARASVPSPFPIVTTHHGVRGLPNLKYRLFEWWYRKRFLNRFDRVLAVSSEDFAMLRDSGVRAEILRLHRNGAQGSCVTDANRAERSRAIRKSWLPNDADADRPFLMGVVARLSPEKDHSRLFETLEQLVSRRTASDWKCLLFGSGPLDSALREESQRRGLADRVIWMGYRENVGAELAGLDLLVSFSKAEGLPINLVEAGYAGTPVLATDVGGVKDLIPDETMGYRVPIDERPEATASRLMDLLTPEGRSDARARAARFQAHVLDGFTQEQWLDKLLGIYAELQVKVSH